MLLKYLLFILVDWSARIFCYFLAPIAAYTSNKDGRTLSIFKWMETPDNLGWNGPLSEPEVAKSMNNPKWALTRWFWRNKAYTLRIKYLGIPRKTKIIKTVGEREAPKNVGFSWFKAINEDGYWYAEVRFSLGEKIGYIYLKMGWKLYNIGLTNGMFAGLTPRIDDWDD